MLFARKIDTCNTSHSKPLLALPLLVAGVLTDHANDPLATDDFALVADLLDAGSNLHLSFPCSYL